MSETGPLLALPQALRTGRPDEILRGKTRPVHTMMFGPERMSLRAVPRTLEARPSETAPWTATAMAKAGSIASAPAVDLTQAWPARVCGPAVQSVHRTRLRHLMGRCGRALRRSAGHVMVLSIDEESQIQVGARPHDPLPRKLGQFTMCSRDDKRHGTVILSAGLDERPSLLVQIIDHFIDKKSMWRYGALSRL